MYFEEKPGHVNPIYEDRLLVFLEDQTKGTFQQVLLNEKQFKRVSDAIFTHKEDVDDLKPGFEAVNIELGTKEISGDTFIGCESITEDEEHRP